jgi:hypothetical protein
MGAVLLAVAPVATAQEAPLSAIDWLSEAVADPVARQAETPAPIEPVDARPIGAPPRDAAGLIAPAAHGLPTDLWQGSSSRAIAAAIAAQPDNQLPAARARLYNLLLAELDPPADTSPEDRVFLARIDKLLAFGALDRAEALLEQAGPDTPAAFARWLDVSLLTGYEDRACAAMLAAPQMAPTLPARIFCLARSGDWPAAALSFGTGEALGRFEPMEADLIARFLDPELFEGEDLLPPDPALTPLSFQMRMAIAERPDLTGQPLALVHADLSELAGWRAQLDAAERLTRSGAIEPQQWFAIYTARVPSASGGVWDRVAAVQALDAALLAGDAAGVARRLPDAFGHMQRAGLTVAFSTIFAERLQRVPLTGDAGLLARRIGLLSPEYERIAQSAVAQTAAERTAFAIARGQAVEAGDGDSMRQAVARAFSDTRPQHRYAWFLDNDRMGEAFLRAALVLSDREGDPGDIADALILLRAVGFEDIARRAALQLLLDRA